MIDWNHLVDWFTSADAPTDGLNAFNKIDPSNLKDMLASSKMDISYLASMAGSLSIDPSTLDEDQLRNILGALRETECSTTSTFDSIIWTNIRNALGKDDDSKLADPEYRAKVITRTGVVQAAFWGAFPLISWAVIAVICIAEVALIGESYGYVWDKKRCKDFVVQLLKSMGLATAGLLGGLKITNDLLKVSGVATVAGVLGDAIVCGTVAYAVGETANDYFRKGCQDDRAALRSIFKQKLKEGRGEARKIAKDRSPAVRRS